MSIEQFLKNKNILVFGLGRQGGGIGDANYLARHGYIVRVIDRYTLNELDIAPSMLEPNIELSLGSEKQSDVDWADIIIQNPGVPDNHPLVLYAKEQYKQVVSAIALFVQFSPIPTIGITGTRGKTTTTMLIYDILNYIYPDQIILGGNLPGTSGLDLFDRCENKKYAVLELSSFQLHSFHHQQISPNYSVVTNLYPDHLNRYSTMDEYLLDKTAIVRYQKKPGFVVYNQENEGSIKIANYANVTKLPYQVSDTANITTLLPGKHNLSNIAAAYRLATALNLESKKVLLAISQFKGVNYRQQLIATLNGVRYINDTTATTPIASVIALKAQTSPTILICGGESKNLPEEILLTEIKNNPHLAHLIVLGSHNLTGFVESLQELVPQKLAGQVNSMEAAVNLAAKLAKPNYTVLLSPGFASFDLFKNEFDRGDQFNHYVSLLAQQKK
ncbi:MAG: UDP-N-acetylmuramoyl-L-alanine--D-glutamate ligase [Candidatus Moraniibacteriota bacterium]|nr:MAG: UDP-N-acetylmuramoyl-L-alanine--D-glutamate ligase [Candidatus Moranbacteria bacterium]